MTTNLKQKYGLTALIAGASEGNGAAFATRLASEGMDLVLIARRIDPLKLLADFLTKTYNIEATYIPCDLANSNAIQQIEDALKGKEINLLVYNAAQSYIGPFIENSFENHSKMAMVNMITPLHMLHTFGQKMVAKRREPLF